MKKEKQIVKTITSLRTNLDTLQGLLAQSNRPAWFDTMLESAWKHYPAAKDAKPVQRKARAKSKRYNYDPLIPTIMDMHKNGQSAYRISRNLKKSKGGKGVPTDVTIRRIIARNESGKKAA